jgi:AcrR family transcriptional regulator
MIPRTKIIKKQGGQRSAGVLHNRKRLDGRSSRPTSSEKKRAEIRHAAYRRFTQSGYHNTTIDDICKEVGISKGSFYWHFEGKQAIFLEILDHWAKEVEVMMAQQFHSVLVDQTPFVAMTKALQREARRGRLMMPVWLEFLAQVQRVDEVRAALKTFHQSIRESIDAMLKSILPKAFKARDRSALASVILSIFIGLMGQEMVDPQSAPFDDTISRFMSALKYYVENAYVTDARLTPMS